MSRQTMIVSLLSRPLAIQHMSDTARLVEVIRGCIRQKRFPSSDFRFVAAQHGRNLSTAKSKVYRGLKKIRVALGKFRDRRSELTPRLRFRAASY